MILYNYIIYWWYINCIILYICIYKLKNCFDYYYIYAIWIYIYTLMLLCYKYECENICVWYSMKKNVKENRARTVLWRITYLNYPPTLIDPRDFFFSFQDWRFIIMMIIIQLCLYMSYTHKYWMYKIFSGNRYFGHVCKYVYCIYINIYTYKYL